MCDSTRRIQPLRVGLRSGNLHWLVVVACMLGWNIITPREPRTAAESVAASCANQDFTETNDRKPDSTLVASRPHQVGYQRQEFKFVTAFGEQQARQLDLWYPTTEREQRYEYKGPLGIKGQIGFATEGATVAAGRHPLLLFSHGFLGSSDQSIFLTESCARAGYIVAAMNHADSLGAGRSRKQEPPKFADYANWTDAKYRDRQKDLTALLNQLLEWNKSDQSPWFGHINESSIGGFGHSLGGYTVLGMAGGWKSWKEPRWKAAVALSPFAQPFNAKGNASDIDIPVMLQGGTLDFGITPFLAPVYRKLNEPKVLLVLKRETHFGWTNLISLGKTTKECVADGNAELMVSYTIAFFDQHLLGVDRSVILEKENSKLDSYHFDSES